MDMQSLRPLAQTNQLILSMIWHSNLQSDLYNYSWSVPEAHHWLSTWCQNCHPYSETSLCTAHPRSHWPHTQILLFHKTRTPKSCNIKPESDLYTNLRLLSRWNSKHRCRTNQMSHPWRQQSPLLWYMMKNYPLLQNFRATFCKTWEPPFEYWWLMWTYSPLTKQRNYNQHAHFANQYSSNQPLEVFS